MKHQTEIVPTDETELAALPPIKQDAIAEEVYAARRYSKRITRTVIMTQGVVSVVLALAVFGLAMRPAKRVYIKLDSVGRATPIKYSDMEHYTPDAAMAKTYLSDWAQFRYGRLRANVLKTFPKNYLFLDSKYGMQVRDKDAKANVIANILAGHEPENDVTIMSTNLTSFGKQSIGTSVVAAGSADIILQKSFQKDGNEKKQTWVIAVRFYLNPDQVEAQSADSPEYQTINPLGLTIVEFIENRANVEPTATEPKP
jgi:type IV secretion system protein VirB5